MTGSGEDHAVVALVSLLLVIGGGELFTTSSEWVGERFGLDRSTTGAVFAALATTLPETLILVLAILQGKGASVGVGTILGGPVTLTTLAVFLLGATAVLYSTRGSRDPSITVDGRQTKRDLRVFLAGFSIAFATVFLRGDLVTITVSALLVTLYLWYLYRVSRRSGSGGGTEPEPLEFGTLLARYGGSIPGVRGDRSHGEEPASLLVGVQTVAAIGMLLVGSHLLVRAIEWASETVVPVPTVIVALLVAPIVSNLPENVDGVIWMGRNKDSLAVEQLTGTLAFQGTVSVAIGVLFTPWEISPAWGTVDFLIATSVAVALVSGSIFYVRVSQRADGVLRPRLFLGIGLFYVAFLATVSYYVVAGYL